MDNIPNLLKAFVIAGGILLVGGTLGLTALIIQRAGSDQSATRRAGSDHPAPLPADATLDLPQGARVEQVVAAGERWLLLGTDALGQQFLVEVDPRTGERVSLLWLQPER